MVGHRAHIIRNRSLGMFSLYPRWRHRRRKKGIWPFFFFFPEAQLQCNPVWNLCLDLQKGKIVTSSSVNSLDCDMKVLLQTVPSPSSFDDKLPSRAFAVTKQWELSLSFQTWSPECLTSVFQLTLYFIWSCFSETEYSRKINAKSTSSRILRFNFLPT